MGWRKAWLIMVATMLVDIDHLLATPIYDPKRCSIGFHPLHELIPIAFYLLLCCVPRYFGLQLRLIGIGLVIHMVLDSIDCYSTNGIFYTAALPVVSCADISNACYNL